MTLFPPARWIVRPLDRERAAALAAALPISPLAAQLLAQRGFADPAAARAFLRAGLEDLSDPDVLADLFKAAERLLATLSGGERIIVYGDYDADGVTSTAILVRGLRALGVRAEVFIPRREVEGYGLNGDAIARLGGPGLLVAADCGITAVDEVTQANAQGLDVIVLDHHLPGATLPPAAAVVGPKRPGQPAVTPFAACGLAYQTIRALWRLAGRSEEPVDLLDLAAVGTLADVVPLVGDNRILARQGLARLAAAPSLGLAALLRQADVTGGVRVRDVTFGLAPRLNAAGRLGDATVAVTLLTTEDPAEAAELAQMLDQENRRRQEITETVMTAAVAQVEESGWGENPALVVAGEGWHAGVIGIVASHLKERYNRPVVMIAVADGVGKGSARSIEPLPMVDALGAVGDLLIRFGGHAMAAGLTIAAEQIEAFRRRFVEEAGRRLGPDDLMPVLAIDAEVDLGTLTPALAREIEQIAPFGPGNGEPLFALRGLRAAATRVVGEGHLRVGLTDGRGYVDAIGFTRGDIAELLAFTGARVDVAGAVELDRWGEQERVSLVLRDLNAPGLDLDAVLADGGLLLDRLFARAEDYVGTGFGGIEGAWSFYTKVVGVTFEGRQESLSSVRPGQPLHLIRQPSNPYDPHAIAVVTADGRQLGFLSAMIAGRLAPSIDAGARYTATASQLTGGGERAHGLNIFIQREEPAAALTGGAWTSWRTLPAEALLDRLRIFLQGGRPLRRAQSATIERLLADGTVTAALGPGRRGAVTAVMAASALGAQRARPAMIVLSLVSQVERWFDTFGPPLREVGFRVYRAHGALPLRPQQRLARALEEGRADIVLASAAWLEREGLEAVPGGLASAVLVGDADMPGPIAERLAAAVTAHLPSAGGLARFLWDGESTGSAGGDRPDTAVINDGFVRTNLRLVDRRGVPDRDGELPALAERGGKTLIFLTDRADAVALAATLRSREGFPTVAYYHGGLPARVRRVIEQLFVDGKIMVLVTTGAFPEVFAPGDIAQVIIGGLPQTRAQLHEMAALAGLAGKGATVVLACAPGDAARNRHVLEERFPSRERLADFYRLLRTEAHRAGVGEGVLWPGDALGSTLGAGWSPQAIESALETLAEAGVIHREMAEGRWRIELLDGGRRELTDSLRYVEGQREREALATVTEVAFAPASAILQALATNVPKGPRV
ncbi:MAG: single-stranded-DNA-specific exonuclease RecJ [bacterium]